MNKIAVIMTGWQAVQFAVANREAAEDFALVLVTGGWEKKILQQFRVIELESFDTYGRFKIKNVGDLYRQLKKLEIFDHHYEELWRPDVGGHIVQLLTRAVNFDRQVLIEDGVGSIAIVKNRTKEISEFMKLIIFFAMMKRLGFLFATTPPVKRLVLHGVSYNAPTADDFVVSEGQYKSSASRLIGLMSNNLLVTNPDVILFTQPFSELGHMSIKQELEMQRRLLTVSGVTPDSSNTIAIKPHPGEEEKFIQLRISALGELGFSCVLSDKGVPAELYVLSLLKPDFIVCSYCSSALLNIKAMLPTVRCIAYIDNRIVRLVDKKIIAAFVRAGVETHAL